MKNVWMLGLLLLTGNMAFSQRENPGEKIRVAKMEFIKKKLALTPEEEKKFMPLYAAMQEDTDALRKEFRQETDLRDLDLTFMDDGDCEKLVDNIVLYREKELVLLKKYDEAFRKVLPIKKVAMIYKAEADFKKELVKKLREGRKQ